MTWFKRVFLFILTNLLILVTINILLWVLQAFFGVRIMPSQISGLMVMCAIWGMGGAFVSLLLSKFMAKTFMGVKILDPNSSDPRARELLDIVSNLAQRAGLPRVPEVGIYESQDPNAFATGPSRSNALVAVSTGLLSRMSHDEVEGVIGHELAHVANGDMVTMTLIQGVVNAFVMFFARIIARIAASQVDEKMQNVVYFVVAIVCDIAFGILGSIVVAMFSRAREYRADAGGARYAGRDKMIAGLRRLQSMYEQLPTDSSPNAVLKISSRPAGLMGLLASHPPLEERIQRLQQLTTV